MSSYPKIASVLVNSGIKRPLDYGILPEQLPLIRRGIQVKVSLNRKMHLGVVCDIKESSSFSKILPIQEIISQQLLISDKLFDLALWMSRYYCTPLPQVLKTLLPATIRENFTPKKQFRVFSKKSEQALREHCKTLRGKQEAQCKVLEAFLLSPRGIFLSQLLEKCGVTKSPVDTLVKNGLLSLELVEVDRSILEEHDYFRTHAKTLSQEQSEALQAITATLTKRSFATHLLFGITGSGKTEIYLQAIEHALSLGLDAIMLVPEISLTTQTIEKFRSRFEEKIAILHHRLTPLERFQQWQKLQKGECRIAIGARSALFSPLPRLGLIIIDEEHDMAYKQGEKQPCYHARDVAVMRAHLENCTLILGSATPSLESYHNVLRGKYNLLPLKQRVGRALLPKVSLVDMKREKERSQGSPFSQALLEGIKERSAKGEQSILFLNRRGYHTQCVCLECGETVQCPHCALALTFHFNDKKLCCHLCGYYLCPPPTQCKGCGTGTPLKYRGLGTEQIERRLRAILPEVRTLRIDGDTTRHKGSHEQLFRAFSSGKSDVLIGTQMITKGLHFPSVTLVAVLNCDSALHIPDFRASEYAFQLMTQVAGRAGRGELPGEVLFQTEMQEHETILLAQNQDYESFFKQESASRELLGFPPYQHIVKCLFSGEEEQKTQEWATLFCQRVRQKLPKAFMLFPVQPCAYAKVKDLFRFQCLIKGPGIYPVTDLIPQILEETPLGGVRLVVDVDPSSTFF